MSSSPSASEELISANRAAQDFHQHRAFQVHIEWLYFQSAFHKRFLWHAVAFHPSSGSQKAAGFVFFHGEVKLLLAETPHFAMNYKLIDQHPRSMSQWRNPRCLVHHKCEKKIRKCFKNVKTPAICKADHFNGCIAFLQHQLADGVGIISRREPRHPAWWLGSSLWAATRHHSCEPLWFAPPVY